MVVLMVAGLFVPVSVATLGTSSKKEKKKKKGQSAGR